MDFNPKKPIKDIVYNPLIKLFALEAHILFLELHESEGVKLIPAPYKKFRNHKIRASTNPGWYRKLYHSISHFRRDRSLDSLKRIANKEDYPFGFFPFCTYDELYRSFIYDKLREDIHENHSYIKKNYKNPKKIFNFFQLDV